MLLVERSEVIGKSGVYFIISVHGCFYHSFLYNLSSNSNFSNYHDGRFKVPFNYTQLQVKYLGLPSETAGNLCRQKLYFHQQVIFLHIWVELQDVISAKEWCFRVFDVFQRWFRDNHSETDFLSSETFGSQNWTALIYSELALMIKHADGNIKMW